MMTFPRILATTSVLALLAGPALADLTAEQVLEDQLKQMEMYGLTAQVTGQNRSGNTVTVDGLTATAAIPEGDFTVQIGGAQFTEMGDGSVLVTYPDQIPVSIKGTSEDGEAFEMSLAIVQSGTQYVVSGIPEQIRYVFSSDSFSVQDFKFLAPEEAAAMEVNLAIAANGVSGSFDMTGATVRNYTADFAVKAFSMLLDMNEPEGGDGTMRLEMNVQDIASSYAGAMTSQDLTDSFAETIRKGAHADGTATYGATTYSFAGDGPQGSFEGAAAIAGGDLAFKFGPEGLDYGGVNRDITFSFGGSSIPVPPMTFKLAESGGRIQIPVVPGEDEQGFALRIGLVGLEVDPALWGMIDPGEQIPRDPANLVVDLDGGVVLTEDIFDPEYAETATTPPGQINALNLNELRLTVGGAELTGDGDFTFDNSMGMPMPAGVANLMLTGGNTLLDTLVGMGLVPEDQAMGARMMMGLFARPGEGPDTLVSTIEMKEDGSVLANGQRIK